MKESASEPVIRHFRFEFHQWQALREASRRRGLSDSAYMRFAISEMLRREKPDLVDCWDGTNPFPVEPEPASA